ncbi:hypothetical protein AGOR_G00236800 [Albula goreensis]|uniref:VWFD domain-containing protein n=1 Tax=Albula goreensis TaxID=1534307 RepID=A0A8T3CHU0_9TELE|nr:hypothetical protein AGOR_G00236800 [Albula goreensis]
MQKESGALQAWLEGAVGGAAGDRSGLWLSINGALQNTLSSLRALPTALRLQGALTHIPTLTEGRLRVMLREAMYELELQHTPGSIGPEHRGMLGEEVGWRRTSLYARAEDQAVCVNVSSGLGSWRVGGLRALLSHTSPSLHTAGLARNGSVLVGWTCGGRGVTARVELQVELWGLRARLEADLREESERLTLLSSLQLHTQGPASASTADYQMNCTVEATEDLLSGQCSGNTAGKGTEMVVRGKVVVLGCSSHLEMQVESDKVEWAGLDLEVSCSPQLGVRGLLRHALPLWGLPSHSNLEMYVTPETPPTAHLHLALGSCRLSASATSNSTSATANLTNHCPALQGAGVPEFVEVSGVWSLALCRSALSCRLSLGRENLALQLERWCEPSAWISGTLTHSFSWLLHRGLPPHSSLTLQAPGGRTQSAVLLLEAGPCRITANGDTGPEGRSQWLWAAESKCPLLQTEWLHSGGSAEQQVQREGCVGRPAGPGFEWTGCSSRSPPPGGPPDHHRLLLTAEASPQQLQGDLRLRLGDCAVRASAQMQSRDRLQGTVQLHNNCTALQDMGIPARMQGSGVLVINRKLLESHLFVHTDESDLQAKGQQEALVQLSHSVPLLHRGGVPANATLSFSSERKADSHQHRLSCSMDSQQLSEVMKVEQALGELRVQCQLDHTLALLRALGLPQTNSIQAKLASGEAHSLAFHSQLGAGTTSLKLKLRDTPKDTEAAGTLQHSSPWQQQLGLPKAVEAMCAVRGALPQLQARASLSVEGEQLLGAGLNISLPARQPDRPEGHLSLLMSLTGTPLLKELKLPHRFNTNVTVHIKGPQQRACWDLKCDRGQIPVAAEEGEEGARGWELKAAVQHITGVPETPALQLDAWGKLTDSQLRGSLAVNRETNSSLAFTVQGHNLADRKELKVRLLQSIRELRSYLPARLGASAQLNHSSSRLGGEAELLLGGGEMRVQGGLAHTQSSFSQDLQLDHSFKQLKILPKNVEMRMRYEGRNRTHRLQQHLLWGGQDLRVSGLYTAPPGPDADTHRLQVQVSSAFAALPHECDLDVQLGGSARSRLDRMLVRWAGLSSYEQVGQSALFLEQWGGRLGGTAGSETAFYPHLSHLHLHALSHRKASSLRYSSQAQFSWNDGKPVNVTLQMNRHRHTDTSRGQACLYLSPGQLETVLPLVDTQGCGSVAQEKNSYSQKAELSWGHKRISQAMSYQRGPRGMHSVQLEGGAENVSPSPCPSHSFLARVKTNCRSQLEHDLLLSVCPPQPSWTISGHHRINTGQELLYSQTRLSVSGHPQHCSFTLALTNASSPQRSNISLHTTFEVGDGGVDLGGSVSSSRKGFGLLMQAKLDGSERVWLQGALKSHCLQTAAGYNDDDDITVALCLEGRGHLIFAAQRRGGGYKRHRLALFSVSPANQSLTLMAQGCVEHLWRTEARVRELSSHIRNKILARIHTLQRLLLEFNCQELSEGPLRLAQRAEVLLIQGLRGVWLGWRSGPLRYALTHTLPLHLHLLHHITQQLQQELKRPLNTLAGVYQDVTGRWLHLDWHHTTTSWAGNLVESLPEVLEDHHLRAPFKAVLGIFTNILDVVSQQTAQWVEAKAAVALTGLRRRLALLFRLSQSRCEVTVQVPLPRRPWSEIGGAGLTEFLLEDWLLKPLLTLSSLSPTAELYQLKRKLMDSPFRYQALFVSDQFVVSFDGHLYEIPETCGLILAHDVVQESFTLLLNPDTTPQRTLVVQMGNITVGIMSEGQVEVNCHLTDAQISQNGVTVRRESHLIEVSNQDGAQLICDQSQALCSLTLDGWQHGVSAGLLGTNDNEAGNEWTRPDGSQANSLDHFIHSWQVNRQCASDSSTAGLCSNGSRAGQTADESSCALLFSSPESPLQPCFRVVDPGQFLSVCKRSCAAVPHSAPCRLAAAFVHMCRRNYVPLEVPQQCVNG